MTLDTATLIKRLAGPAAAASGNSTLFTPTASHAYTIKKIRVVNTDTANAKTFQLFIGGSTAATAITPVLTLDAGGFAESDDFIVLTAAADTLQTTVSATGLTFSVYGLDQS